METTDRPHRSNSSNNSGCGSSSTSNNTSELFICFTSRLSSSSMKLSSKSILSPGRPRESSQISLSNSLSRRLRSNGSMRGGQASPMFPPPTNGKKRGSAFENPEPSSPKVTCIGQVRVKTKKQSKKLRARSKRRAGEISFRRVEQNNNNSSSIHVDQCSELQEYSLANHHHHQQQQQEGLPHRNQRWVHLSLTICEALRSFGAEFNCFLPCRSSCLANEKEKEEKASGSGHRSSCGAVFARWLVAVQEGEGKDREIELVVGEEKRDEGDDNGRRRSYRRHVLEEIEFNDEKFGVGNDGGEEEEEARVSICVPPKNALLLMRCRSDPVKMAALANKFWEAPVPQEGDDDESEEKSKAEQVSTKFWEAAVPEFSNDRDETRKTEAGAGEEEQREVEMEHNEEASMGENLVSCEAGEEQQIQDTEAISAVLPETEDDRVDSDIGNVVVQGEIIVNQEKEMEVEIINQQVVTQESIAGGSSSDVVTLDAIVESSTDSHHENEENVNVQEKEEAEDFGSDNIHEETISSLCAQGHEQEEEMEEVVGQGLQQEEEEPEPEPPAVAEESLTVEEELKAEEKETAEKKTTSLELEGVVGEALAEAEAEEGEKVTHQGSESKDPETHGIQERPKSNEKESQPLLPDCLLLMMCEPKLSMEVSKETWVCSTDFIRWLPEHSRPPVNKKDGPDETRKRRSIDRKVAAAPASNLQQPPRSSCSYPARPPARGPGTESMSSMIEQKLAGAKTTTKGYEPLVLTRCKSEPMRSGNKLAPEPCFWKNRKLEPHRPATLGVGATGVGF